MPHVKLLLFLKVRNMLCWFFNKETKKITEKDFERKNTAALSKGIVLSIIHRHTIIAIISN